MGGVPTNSRYAKDRGCSPVSSNCVVWQGPNLACIDLCKGDTVSDVIAKLATELCTLMDMFKLTEFDFSCLELRPSEAPTNAGQLLQILIDRVCALEGITPTSGGSSSPSCPDNCIVPIADCFYYVNEFGDSITTMSLLDYVLTIGNRICSILDEITVLQEEVNTLQTQVNGSDGLITRMNTVETDKVDESKLYYQVNTYTDPSAGTKFITEALRSVENSLLGTQNGLGTTTELYQNILKAGNIGNEAKMFGSGNMNSITGWIPEVSKGAQSIGNLWLAIHDIRSAVSYIQENCCSSACSDIFLNLRAEVSGTFLTIYTDGSTGFTPEWKECDGTTRIIITDTLGNSSTTTMKVLAYINNPSGYSIDLTSTAVDMSENITITAETCFLNTKTESSCSKDYIYTIIQSPNCPATIVTVYATSINYQFTATPGYGYIINVYYKGGSVPVASQIISRPGIVVNYNIIGLLSETDYELEVVLVNTSGVETPCTRQAFTTLPDNCTPPINATVNLTI